MLSIKIKLNVAPKTVIDLVVLITVKKNRGLNVIVSISVFSFLNRYI